MPTRLYGKQRVNANKQKKAAKGNKANKENERRCCVPHCENEASITKAPCGHNLCGHCLLQLMKCYTAPPPRPICTNPMFMVKCPMCRLVSAIQVDDVKCIMAAHCPTHQKEMPCGCPADCDKVWTVKHQACEHGCYNCEKSTLVATAKLPPINPYELDTMVFALNEDGTRYYDITMHDLNWWVAEMYQGAPEVDEWRAVPDDLLLPGMQAAYFNADEFCEYMTA